MPINPVQFAHGVCDEFLRYLFSAFPLSDPELADQAKKLLERPSSLDIPLVQGPFVSLSEAFAKGEAITSLASKGILHHVMPELIGYPTMWKHQQQVFEAVKKSNHVLVATGTGSGKTEAFLYPIVDDLLRQRDQGITSGLTAILIYPMNALANDQLDRLRDMLGGTNITFGLWVGTTPDTEKDVSVDRFQGSGRQAYLAERQKRRDEAQAEDRAVRPLAPLEECCSEEDTLTGKVVPFDFKEKRWCKFLDVPQFGKLFGFMGGPIPHHGRYYFSLSTYNGTNTGCDGKPYHFCNAILEFDPQTRHFEFLTLEAKDAYHQIAYMLSAKGEFFATGSNIREKDGKLNQGRAGEVVFWQTMKPASKRTLNHFQKTLDKAMTPTKAVAAFGDPDRKLGSGLIIYEYDLDDGTKMRLGFPGLAPFQYAHHVQKDGKFVVIPVK